MKEILKKTAAVLLAFCLISGLFPSADAAYTPPLAAAEVTAAYLKKTVTAPTVGSVGGEWSVLGLSRFGYAGGEDWFALYYKNLSAFVTAADGVLSTRKYTEYARVTLALMVLGKDPRFVAGYDLLSPLGDYDKVILQGINGPVYALIALDAGGYEMPACSSGGTQATREMYLDYILNRQHSDGGWSLTGDASEPDVTGMVLQALAEYQDLPKVGAATEEALFCLSALQNGEGGYDNWGSPNAESVCQVILALCELGLGPDDGRFIKNGYSLTDNLLTFRRSEGGFAHIRSEAASNLMATEQALCAMAACLRLERGDKSFYTMTEPESFVAVPAVSAEGKTFTDLSGHPSQGAVEALASRGIINGMTETEFMPERTMTRAEFAAITVRALGLETVSDAVFDDVNAFDWYEGYVGAAYTYGIVNGVSPTLFCPGNTITRAEAAAMIARAAKLCGMNTAAAEAAAGPVLSKYSDGGSVAAWAREPVTFCLRSGILDRSGTLQPDEPVTRAEIADMLYAMLKAAELI